MTPFEYVAALFVASVASARITRLATYDSFPPAEWVRKQWSRITKENGYELLFYCGYCFGFWVGVATVAWAYLSDFSTAWWLWNCAWTVAYLAPIIMAHDGDD